MKEHRHPPSGGGSMADAEEEEYLPRCEVCRHQMNTRARQCKASAHAYVTTLLRVERYHMACTAPCDSNGGAPRYGQHLAKIGVGHVAAAASVGCSVTKKRRRTLWFGHAKDLYERPSGRGGRGGGAAASGHGASPRREQPTKTR